MAKTRLALSAVVILCASMIAGAAHANRYYRELVLINGSHAPVSAFYVSHHGDDAWQGDMLDGARLRPNHYVHLDLDDTTGRCHFDFKTVYADGTSVIRRNINACTLATYRLTD